MLRHFPLSAPLVQSLLDNFFNTTTHNIYNGRSCLPDKKYLGKYLLMYVHTICIHAHFVSKNLLCL